MSLTVGPAVLRPIRPDDAEPMTAIADDWEVARNLSEWFPHPYTGADAEAWIGLHDEADPQRYWVIESEGRLAGGIGLTPFGGYRQGRVEIGDWLDRRHLNPNGVVHGSVPFAMIDTAMGGACMSILGEGRFCATIDIHTRYLSSASTGTIEVEAVVRRSGRRVIHLGASARVGDEEIVTAVGSFAVLGEA